MVVVHVLDEPDDVPRDLLPFVDSVLLSWTSVWLGDDGPRLMAARIPTDGSAFAPHS